MASTILPEFFALLAVDLFALLSMLTCLLEERFPKSISYVYVVGAVIGFGHLWVSREFLVVFGDHMRFLYSVLYLAIALANVVAVNLYLATSKKAWTLAKAWSVAVTFPTVFISLFSVYNYGYLQGTAFPLVMLQLVIAGCVVILGISIGALLSPNLMEKLRRR
ncbi:MAG: hypothetical protein PVF15_06750 [Candidatus Bathyarchaeota archaeon]